MTIRSFSFGANVKKWTVPQNILEEEGEPKKYCSG